MLDLVDEWDHDDTIVIYSTDNGRHDEQAGPMGRHDALPQREEIQLGRPTGSRDGALAGGGPKKHFFPGKQGPGGGKGGGPVTGIVTISTGCPTLLAAARGTGHQAEVPARVTRWQASFKVISDGYKCSTMAGKTDTRPRVDYFLLSLIDGDLTALRYDTGSSCSGAALHRETLARSGLEPACTVLRIPKIYYLLPDPYERATSPQTPTGLACWTTSPVIPPRRGWHATGKPQRSFRSPGRRSFTVGLPSKKNDLHPT